MKQRQYGRIAAFIVLMTISASTPAQTPPKRPQIASPEIMPGGRVAFRIYAPKAQEIQLSGDWMGREEGLLALTKGPDSVWIIVIDAPPPNIYTYKFVVDGVEAIDPAGWHSVLAAGRSGASVLEIPGKAPLPWDDNQVPHGAIHIESFDSKLQQRRRSFYVYTPPDYRSSPNRKYPVLVLLPGTPGTEAEWINVGFAHRVLDNLLAEGRIKEMVVLMPRSDVLISAGNRADNLKIFEPLLLTEVLPVFEERYRVARHPESRAIAGVSLGGELAFTVGFRHPEVFRWLGSLAGSLFEREFEVRYGGAYQRPAQVNETYKLVWLACGTGDVFLTGARNFSELLTQKRVKHTYRETPGLHNFATFRQQLVEFLPLLFR